MLYKRGDTWWCDFSVRGERVRKSTGVRAVTAKPTAEAKLFESRLLQEVERRGTVAGRVPTLGEFLPEFEGWVEQAERRGELAHASLMNYGFGIRVLRRRTGLVGQRLDMLTADAVLGALGGLHLGSDEHDGADAAAGVEQSGGVAADRVGAQVAAGEGTAADGDDTAGAGKGVA